MYSSNRPRSRKTKNQPPPPKVLEKLKLDHRSQNVSAFSYSKLIFILLIFVTSICIGFLGFSFIFNPKIKDDTFLPFGEKYTFPIYDIFDGIENFWSTLIPGHYFALRAAKPNSTLVSFMWFRQKLTPDEGLPIRHLCRQEDKLNSYSWNYNDLYNFAHQTLYDKNLHINTSFIRINSDVLVSKITVIDNNQNKDLNSIILYTIAEDINDNITLIGSENGFLSINTQSKHGGNYILNFKVNKGKVLLQSTLLTNTTLDKIKNTIESNIFFYKYNGQTLFIISNQQQDELILNQYNFIAYQVIFNNSIEIDIEMLFHNSEIPKEFNYETSLEENMQKFNANFEQRFKNLQFHEELTKFSRNTLSNLIGSIGYYYGHSLVDAERSKPRPYGPIQLLAVAPSRSMFPRGFLWDEGFHQLLLSQWDPKLSMKIIKSWYLLMNKNGWIPREVILGREAMSRVPNEFIVQHSYVANPPSLLLAIESLIDMKNDDNQWLTDIYPRLHKWFHWFNNTQHGYLPFTYRWRGRNSTTNLELNPKTFASGFDDYPRATHPSDDEIHLDLRCWMALASRLMSKISHVLHLNDEFENSYKILSDNALLEKLHWSDQYEMFCDKGLNANVTLRKYLKNGKWIVERQDLSKVKYDCIPEFGYVSLFPFIMNLLNADNPKLMSILENIENPKVLWTPYGLRSLSKTSYYYKKYNTEHDGPYWRGSIWINMNYLILKSLNYYRKISGPYQHHAQRLHKELKANLVKNVFNEFIRTGYIWEQYDDNNGRGIGAHPFTGWSSLIVQIMNNE